jgi:hypothetical protein
MPHTLWPVRAVNGKGFLMRLTMVRGSCIGGDCPTVYATDRGTLVVQGAVVPDAEGVNVPAGETLVEVPAELLAGLKVDR